MLQRFVGIFDTDTQPRSYLSHRHGLRRQILLFRGHARMQRYSQLLAGRASAGTSGLQPHLQDSPYYGRAPAAA